MACAHITLRRRLLATGLAAAMAGGCAVKTPPDAAALKIAALPTLQPPAAWTAPTAGPVSNGWLATFQDEQLAAAVNEAIAHNADLRVGASRVEQAQLYAKLAGAKLYPSVDVLARGGGKLSGDGSGIQGVVLSANWELDLWARVRNGRAASVAQAAAAAADFVYARESIAALVAKSWFLAIELGLQAGAARDTIRANEELVRLIGDRARIGAGNEVDLYASRASVAVYRDALRELELGRYPSAAAVVSPQLPAFPGEVPAGLPSELLERRPDVIAAERRVAVAFHRVGEAKAARLPKISLTTGLSAISSELFVLQDHNNPVWSIGANLLAPIFNGGALKTQVEIRTAEQKQAVAEYAVVGLRAFGEVEAALASEIAAREREQILSGAVADNEQALSLAQTQFRVGSNDLRLVEQRQLALTSSRSALIRMQAEQRMQRVNLHLALGGSFTLPPAATPTSTPPPGGRSEDRRQ
jgi:outer membrane protein, multidrug efflux system